MDRLISENMAWHYTKLAMPLSERAKLKEAFEMVPDVDVQLEVSKRLERKIREEAYKAFAGRLKEEVNDQVSWTEKERVIDIIDTVLEDVIAEDEDI